MVLHKNLTRVIQPFPRHLWWNRRSICDLTEGRLDKQDLRAAWEILSTVLDQLEMLDCKSRICHESQRALPSTLDPDKLTDMYVLSRQRSVLRQHDVDVRAVIEGDLCISSAFRPASASSERDRPLSLMRQRPLALRYALLRTDCPSQ